MLSTTVADAHALARFHGLLADHFDGVVAVTAGGFSVPVPGGAPLPGGTLGPLLAGLSSVPRDVEQIAYVDEVVLDSLGIQPILQMMSWLDEDHAAVVRAAPVTDALKVVDGTRLVGAVDRTGLFVPQPPHIIRREALDAALRFGRPTERGDDPTKLLLAAGHAVRLVPDAGPPVTLAAAR